MASVLFTALALIAAGQAEVPNAPTEGARAQTVRSSQITATAPGPRARNRDRR